MQGGTPTMNAGLRQIRYDASAAADSFAALIPQSNHRRAVAELLAASIRYAHRQAPSSWELTAWLDFIRLNVGQIAVLDVSATDLRVYGAKGPSLSAYGYRRTGFGHYRAVKASGECWRVPIHRVITLAKPLLALHRDLVREAADAKRVSPFKRSHSPGFVKALAQFTGSALPQPAYQRQWDEDIPNVNDTDAVEEACFGSPASRREVEQAAVGIVTAHLTAKGWKVQSVERDRCGYDLHCSRRNKELHVEVKGTSGPPDKFIITSGEVRRAENDKEFVLVLVGQALQADPTLERWTGTDLLRSFELEPIQYFARRSSA
jgi:hypothetical protein